MNEVSEGSEIEGVECATITQADLLMDALSLLGSGAIPLLETQAALERATL